MPSFSHPLGVAGKGNAKVTFGIVFNLGTIPIIKCTFLSPLMGDFGGNPTSPDLAAMDFRGCLGGGLFSQTPRKHLTPFFLLKLIILRTNRKRNSLSY